MRVVSHLDVVRSFVTEHNTQPPRMKMGNEGEVRRSRQELTHPSLARLLRLVDNTLWHLVALAAYATS